MLKPLVRDSGSAPFCKKEKKLLECVLFRNVLLRNRRVKNNIKSTNCYHSDVKSKCMVEPQATQHVQFEC